MKRKKVWRYYCGHCKKSGGHAGYMRKHEKGCTNNPNRVCGMCARAGNVQHTTKELIDSISKEHVKYGTELSEEGLLLLREKVGGCPACVLAAFRQGDFWPVGEWNFKTARDAFWDKHNLKRYREHMGMQ